MTLCRYFMSTQNQIKISTHPVFFCSKSLAPTAFKHDRDSVQPQVERNSTISWHTQPQRRSQQRAMPTNGCSWLASERQCCPSPELDTPSRPAAWEESSTGLLHQQHLLRLHYFSFQSDHHAVNVLTSVLLQVCKMWCGNQV